MPVLHVNEQQYPLEPGETRLGAPDAAEVPVAAGIGVQAIVEVQAGEGATIRRAADDANVRVNGVALGAEPTPLLHGDRVEIAGVEIRYADDAKAGETQYVAAGHVAELAARRGGAQGTTGTGGRLVSLVDGKEYAVPATGLVIGREVGADVVVPLAEVSRRHAEIVPTSEGYRLTDLSTNGVLVNGERVTQSRLLNRSDVIRVGTEEFRFYADVARAADRAPAPAPPPPPPPSLTPIMTPAAAPPARPAAEADVTPKPRPAPPTQHPEAAPLTAGPPRGAAAKRPVPKRPEPVPAAGGRMPRWLWLLLVLAIAAVALVVMG